MRRVAPASQSSPLISRRSGKAFRQRSSGPRLRRLGILALAILSLAIPPFFLETPTDVRATPTASGAEPPYPLNHTIDGNIQPAGIPPLESGFETDPFTVGTPPTNHDLSSAASQMGTPPTNNDFETGSLSPWTTSGTVTLQSSGETGYYPRFDTSGASVTSDAFTVDSTAQHLVYDVGFLSITGNTWVIAYVLSGATYSTSTQIGSYQCNSCNYWQTM